MNLRPAGAPPRLAVIGTILKGRKKALPVSTAAQVVVAPRKFRKRRGCGAAGGAP